MAAQETTNQAQALPLDFHRDGFDFRLRLRDGDVAMLSKTKKGYSFELWEVVLIQHHKERTFPNGRTVSAREGMPSDEQWGRQGWSYSERGDAERKFNALRGAMI